MNKLVVSCEKATYLVSKSRDQELTCKEKMDMHMHLAGCKFCRRYKKDIDILSNNLQDFRKNIEKDSSFIELTPEQKKRIKEKMNSSEKD